jgi:hypothetical protein
MAKVPLPERGQPIDVAYLYQLSNAINQLSDQVSSSTNNFTTVDTNSAGKQNIKTSEARLVGGIKSVATNRSVDATEVFPFTYTFDVNFLYPPVVTASPVNVGLTPAGENVSVVITDVNRSSVSGIVRFNTEGTLSTSVHIIAIGVANT